MIRARTQYGLSHLAIPLPDGTRACVPWECLAGPRSSPRPAKALLAVYPEWGSLLLDWATMAAGKGLVERLRVRAIAQGLRQRRHSRFWVLPARNDAVRCAILVVLLMPLLALGIEAFSASVKPANRILVPPATESEQAALREFDAAMARARQGPWIAFGLAGAVAIALPLLRRKVSPAKRILAMRVDSDGLHLHCEDGVVRDVGWPAWLTCRRDPHIRRFSAAIRGASFSGSSEFELAVRAVRRLHNRSPRRSSTFADHVKCTRLAWAALLVLGAVLALAVQNRPGGNELGTAGAVLLGFLVPHAMGALLALDQLGWWRRTLRVLRAAFLPGLRPSRTSRTAVRL